VRSRHPDTAIGRRKKGLKLLEEYAKICLEWALAHRNWTLVQWRNIIWTDECSVEVGKGKRDQWVFRLNQSGEMWKKKYIQPYSKSKNISIMIWAAIWGGGHSEAIEMTGDPNDPKKGYSARSYLSLLEEMIPTIWSPGIIKVSMASLLKVLATYLMKRGSC
jgi:hypothetical protein